MKSLIKLVSNISWYIIVGKLEEEFRVNIDRVLEDRRPTGKEPEYKEKFITSNEMRE